MIIERSVKSGNYIRSTSEVVVDCELCSVTFKFPFSNIFIELLSAVVCFMICVFFGMCCCIYNIFVFTHKIISSVFGCNIIHNFKKKSN